MSKESSPEESKPPQFPYYGGVVPYSDLSTGNAGGDSGFSFFDLLGLLRRRWEIVLSITVIGTCVASAYGFMRTPIYEATAALLIESENKVVDLDTVVEGVGSDATAIETQINLLKSRGFLEDFIRKANLDELAGRRAASELDKLKVLVDTTNMLGGAFAATHDVLPEIQDDEASIGDELRSLVDGLIVSQQGRSYIINVTYKSSDPLRAEEVANGIAEHYIAEQTSRRRKVTGDASDFLEERLAELKKELIDAERAVQSYRSSEALNSEEAGNLTSEQLTDLTALAIRARADRKEKEARISYIEQLRVQGSNLESLTEVLQSPYMVTLWQEESALRNREAELQLEFGVNHPKIQSLAKERKEIDERMQVEIGRIIANAKNELEVLKEREKSLDEDIGELIGLASNDAANIDKASIKLRILEGEAAASRRIFEEFLIRLKETREQEAVIQANTRLIARAQIPTKPAGRGPMVYGFLGLVASSVVGCGLAFLRDKADRNLRSSKEITTALGLPCLGQVPFMSEKKRDNRKLHKYLIKKPVSAYAESIRSIYTKIWMQSIDEQPKIIQVTSSLPAEGKTTFAVSLATLLALDGKKTLLIDLDFRHPSVGREIDEVEDIQSLDEFLRGESTITDSMVYSSGKGCDVIGVKSGVNDPAALIRSIRLKTLIEQMKGGYDHIIIDSAPSLGLSDSKATFVYADTVVFVVQWNKTSVDDAIDALDDLRSCNTKICGIILTQVKVNQQSRYGYRGIDQYYGKNENYYNN